MAILIFLSHILLPGGLEWPVLPAPYQSLKN